MRAIVNETIDINDGGVSGVLEGGIVEFAPGVVPRFVEQSRETPVPAFLRDIGLSLLEVAYGVRAGRYTTAQGWHDPYELMAKEDPKKEVLASCLVQEEVRAEFSGAPLTGPR